MCLALVLISFGWLYELMRQMFDLDHSQTSELSLCGDNACLCATGLADRAAQLR
jgi:hypothetical protein